MKNVIKDIREKTSEMSKGERVSYILTYYWYHILGVVSVVALIFIFAMHYIGKQEVTFSCVRVNREINTARDNEITKEFAKFSGEKTDSIVIDSNYNFSYGDVKLEGVNESSYEKFFLQWRNGELDAVIMPKSFYQHCLEMNGEFLEIDKDNGTFVLLGEDQNGEDIVLAFPSTGKHEKMRKEFLNYVNALEMNEEKGSTGGITIEEIIN